MRNLLLISCLLAVVLVAGSHAQAPATPAPQKPAPVPGTHDHGVGADRIRTTRAD